MNKTNNANATRPKLQGSKRNNRPKRNVVAAPGPRSSEVSKPIRNPFTRITGPGRSWLRNYLNPCGEAEMAEIGIPDGSSTMAAHKNSRVDVSVACPDELSKLVAGANDMQGGNWWLCAIVPPWSDDCVILMATGVELTKAPPELYSRLNFVGTYPQWTREDVNGGTTAKADSIWLSRIPSPGIPSTLGTNEDGDSVSYAAQFRYTKRGITCHLVADDLTNRGTVTAAQWFCKPQPEVYSTRSVPTNSTSKDAVITEVGFGWSILTGEIAPIKLTAADERAYQGEAKEGCYMPIYRSGTDFTYQPYAPRAVFLHATSDTSNNAEIAPDDGLTAGGLPVKTKR